MTAHRSAHTTLLLIMLLAESMSADPLQAPHTARLPPLLGNPQMDMSLDALGRIHLVYSIDDTTELLIDGIFASDVYYTQSLDLGRSWAEPIRVSEPGPYRRNRYPTLALSRSSRVAVAWVAFLPYLAEPGLRVRELDLLRARFNGVIRLGSGKPHAQMIDLAYVENSLVCLWIRERTSQTSDLLVTRLLRSTDDALASVQTDSLWSVHEGVGGDLAVVGSSVFVAALGRVGGESRHAAVIWRGCCHAGPWRERAIHLDWKIGDERLDAVGANGEVALGLVEQRSDELLGRVHILSIDPVDLSLIADTPLPSANLLVRDPRIGLVHGRWWCVGHVSEPWHLGSYQLWRTTSATTATSQLTVPSWSYGMRFQAVADRAVAAWLQVSNGFEVEIVTAASTEAPVIGPQSTIGARIVPNPITMATVPWIELLVRDRGALSLRVYDVSGRVVGTSRTRVLNAGLHRTTMPVGRWDPAAVPAGVYFFEVVRITVPNDRIVVRAVVAP